MAALVLTHAVLSSAFYPFKGTPSSLRRGEQWANHITRCAHTRTLMAHTPAGIHIDLACSHSWR